MAFPLLKTSFSKFCLKFTSSILPIKCTPRIGNRFLLNFTRCVSVTKIRRCQITLDFDSNSMNQCDITKEIQFFRDSRNNFTKMNYSDTTANYGPPLAIILPWQGLKKALLKNIIEFYCEKGFDALTVQLTTQQILFPCVAGNGMDVVTELLKYLNEAQKHRPYVFHGFSIGVYIYGEMMAQFSEDFEQYCWITNNLKGCLWDSPVDPLCVRNYVGKSLYPKNFFKRYRLNKAVKVHFKKHYHDSVTYWLRSRDNFASPFVKVPNIFFTSYADRLSNPCTVEDVLKSLECCGVPFFQKTWWDSPHGHHYEKYCYEYKHGMVLFLNMSNLFPNECGKYETTFTKACLACPKLKKETKANMCAFIEK